MTPDEIMELAREYLQQAESSYQSGDLKSAMEHLEKSGKQLAKLQIVTVN